MGQMKYKPGKLRNPDADKALGGAGVVVGFLVACVFLVLACKSMLNGHWAAMFVALADAIVLFPLCAILWKLADALRRFIAPDRIYARDAGQMLGRRIAWLIGPQVISIVIPIFLAYGFWASAERAALRGP
jgi:hypothetical protein